MKTRHPVGLRAQSVSKILAWRSDRLTHMADRLFREVCADPVLEAYIASLPLGGLPEIRRALSEGVIQPEKEMLEKAVHSAIKRDWRQLSPATIDRATNTYVCCLRRVLPHSGSLRSAREHNVQTGEMTHQVLNAQS